MNQALIEKRQYEIKLEEYNLKKDFIINRSMNTKPNNEDSPITNRKYFHNYKFKYSNMGY